MPALQGQSPQTLAVAAAALLGAGVAAGIVSLSLFDDGMAATPAPRALILVNASALPAAAPRLAPRPAVVASDAAMVDAYAETDPDAELYRSADGTIHDAADEIGRGVPEG